MITVRVVNEREELFSGNVSKIIAPGTEGEFTVLPRHIPFLTGLKKGVVTLSHEGQDSFFEVPSSGVFELSPGNQAVILLSTKETEEA